MSLCHCCDGMQRPCAASAPPSAPSRASRMASATWPATTRPAPSTGGTARASTPASTSPSAPALPISRDAAPGVCQHPLDCTAMDGPQLVVVPGPLTLPFHHLPGVLLVCLSLSPDTSLPRVLLGPGVCLPCPPLPPCAECCLSSAVGTDVVFPFTLSSYGPGSTASILSSFSKPLYRTLSSRNRYPASLGWYLLIPLCGSRSRRAPVSGALQSLYWAGTHARESGQHFSLPDVTLR